MMHAADASRSSAAAGTIRVFLADDHRVTLWGLQQLIDSAGPRMRVIGTATTRNELLNSDAVSDADIVLLDLDLGGEKSTEVLDDLQRRCGGHVLVLTAADDPEQYREAMMKGVRGVLHKSESADIVLRAIEKICAGELWVQGALLGEVLGRLTGRRPASMPRDPHAERIASLTPREREIVATMVRMTGAKQIAVAEDLGMSEHTLRNHLTTIYSKLAVHGRLELHVYATEHGLGSSRY
jgi:DNA-binding NarL/FixJ family response regulator